MASGSPSTADEAARLNLPCSGQQRGPGRELAPDAVRRLADPGYDPSARFGGGRGSQRRTDLRAAPSAGTVAAPAPGREDTVAVDQVIDYAAVGSTRRPKMLHRTDCPHQVVGVTRFKPADAEQLKSLPECSDCARKDG
jgi:hypothetical protein